MWQVPELTLLFDSLGWAVLHSVWQGALAALLVWTFRTFTKESAADVRYMFGFVTLTALLAAFVATFIYYFNIGAAAGETTISLFGLAEPATGGAVGGETVSPFALLFSSTDLIGSIWALCFAVLGARYLAAFRLTHKLRTTGLSDLPAHCQQRFAKLIDKSGVSAKTKAFISEHVSSPITFGFFKPIVLVPAWFFTGMDADQCEAVLLHELAHIRRHDYLANILQIMIKTVFFYHPAVQYISKSVDIDREHACDDFAVQMTSNPEGLAKALGLIRIKAARGGGVFALSADGPEAPLMQRLKRLMGTPVKKSQTGAVRGFASASLLALSCVLVLTLGATQSEAHPQSEADAEEAARHAEDKLAGSAKSDWGPKAYNYGTFTKDGKTYMVKTDAYGTSYVNIDGNWFNIKARKDLKIIPPKAPIAPTVPPYPVVDAAPMAVPHVPVPTVTASNSYSWAAPQDVEVLAAQSRELAQEQAEIARELAQEQAELSREWAEEQAEYQRELAERQAEHQQDMAEYQREIEAHQHEIEKNHKNHKEHAEDHAREQVEVQRELAREQAEHVREMAELKRELGQEQREYQREVVQAQREAAQEQVQLQRELAQEQREAAREYAERTHENKEHKRAEKERVKADKQAKKYEHMRERLIPQLTRDGFMKSEKSKVTLKLTEQDIFINGQKLPNHQEGEYCDIVSDYIKRKGDVKKIVIKPGYLHVESKGNNGHSSYTFNETDSDW